MSSSSPTEDAGAASAGDSSYWPSPSVLTARLRRLITASQRFTKSRQIMQIHQSQTQTQQAMMLSAPLYPLPPTVNDVLNPKMAAKIERQQRSERRQPRPGVCSEWRDSDAMLHSPQVDEAGGGRLLPRGVHLRRGLRPQPQPLRLGQVQGHGAAAQEDRREPAEVPVRFHRHVPTGVSPAAQRRRWEARTNRRLRDCWPVAGWGNTHQETVAMSNSI